MTIPPQLDQGRTLGVLQPEPNTPDERRRAALYTASNANSAAELAELLDMLGLTTRGGHNLRPLGAAARGVHNLHTPGAADGPTSERA